MSTEKTRFWGRTRRRLGDRGAGSRIVARRRRLLVSHARLREFLFRDEHAETSTIKGILNGQWRQGFATFI